MSRRAVWFYLVYQKSVGPEQQIHYIIILVQINQNQPQQFNLYRNYINFFNRRACFTWFYLVYLKSNGQNNRYVTLGSWFKLTKNNHSSLTCSEMLLCLAGGWMLFLVGESETGLFLLFHQIQSKYFIQHRFTAV